MNNWFISFTVACAIVLSMYGVAIVLAVSDVKKNEDYYNTKICSFLQGKREFVIPGGRIDCLTKEVAFETDWAHKYHEAIGQSLHYAIKTQRVPGIVLLVKGDKDIKYIQELSDLLQQFGISYVLIIYDTRHDSAYLVEYPLPPVREDIRSHIHEV